MFDVDTSCPYLCSDCYEEGCAFCNIDAEIAAAMGEDYDEDYTYNDQTRDNLSVYQKSSH